MIKLLCILLLFFSLVVAGQANHQSIENVVSENIVDIHAVDEELVVFSFLEYRETDNKAIYEIVHVNNYPIYLSIDAHYQFVEAQSSLTHSFFLFESTQDSILLVSLHHQSGRVEKHNLFSPIALFASERSLLQLSSANQKLWLYAFFSQQENNVADIVYCFDQDLKLLSQTQLASKNDFFETVSKTVFNDGGCTFLHSVDYNAQTNEFISRLDYMLTHDNMYKRVLLSDQSGHYIPHIIEFRQGNLHISGIYCSNPTDLDEMHQVFYQRINKEGELIMSKRYSIENHVKEKSYSDKVRNRSARKLKVKNVLFTDTTISIISEAYYIENGNSTLKFLLDVIEPNRFVVRLGNAFQTTLDVNGNVLITKQYKLFDSSILLAATTDTLAANLLNQQQSIPYIFQLQSIKEDEISVVHHKQYETYITSFGLSGKKDTLSTQLILDDTTQFNVKHNFVDQNNALNSVNEMKLKASKIADKFQQFTNAIEYAIEQVDFALELLNPLRKNYLVLSSGNLLAYWLDVDSQRLIYTKINTK